MNGQARKRFAQLRQMFLQERGSASRLAFTTGNTVRLCETGAEFFHALIERIDAAREQVMLETYIFCDDAAGRPVSDALIRATQRGVRVRVITDGVGTARLPLFDAWAAAGVEHSIYNRYLFGRFGFSRTHRKLAVIDHAVAFCGGINIVDDYTQGSATLPFPRWDFAVEMAGPRWPTCAPRSSCNGTASASATSRMRSTRPGCTAAKRSRTCSGAGCATIAGSRPARCGS
jgi:cardiolipin synthase